jgi:hypothetical protein
MFALVDVRVCLRETVDGIPGRLNPGVPEAEVGVGNTD